MDYDDIEYLSLRGLFASPKILLKTNNSDEIHEYINNIDNIIGDNGEGVVIYQPSTNIRVKVKTKHYLELHKLMYVNNERSLFNSLIKNKNTIDIELLNDIPDEWYDSIKSMQNYITSEVDRIINEVSDYMTNTNEVLRYIIDKSKENRKSMAIAIKDFKYKSIVFKLLDGKRDDNILFDIVSSEKTW
jgi:hypothetical protein